MHTLKRSMFAAFAALSLLTASCTTTGSIGGPGGVVMAANTALVATDKALIVANAAYHAAQQVAVVAVRNGTIRGPALVKLGTASDAAAAALHTAYELRTSSAVASAVAAIALFTTLSGVKP